MALSWPMRSLPDVATHLSLRMGATKPTRPLLIALAKRYPSWATPMGTQIRTNEAKETGMSGVFACGDAARVPHSISLAVGDGAWARAQVHQSLVFAAAA